MAYADKVRNMGDDDYAKFKENFGKNHFYKY